MTESYDIAVVGQGAAGFSAALYAARYRTNTILIGDTFGGETATGGTIENYPGHPDIDGYELMTLFRAQVERYEVPIVEERVTKISRVEACYELETGAGVVFQAQAVILAVGRERRKLGLEHEDEWTGRGVSFCSVCDAPLHRGNTVAVVGGGNAATEGAVLLSRYAEKVYLIYRGSALFRPDAVLLDELGRAENIDIVLNTSVVKLSGDNGLEGILLERKSEGRRNLAIQGLFVEIGASPRVELTRQLGVELNEHGEITVDRKMRTNVPGLFAAGDVTDASGDLKQTVTAAAQGATAASTAYSYIAENSGICRWHARSVDF